jgi:prolipoprotein diacylglyceryltransferase
MFFWYLVLASGARFLVEFVRINPVVAAGLTAAQLASLALVGIGVVGLLAQRRWQTVAV